MKVCKFEKQDFDTGCVVDGGWELPTGDLETAFLKDNRPIVDQSPAKQIVDDNNIVLLDIIHLHFGFVPPLPMPECVQAELGVAECRALITLVGLTDVTVADLVHCGPILKSSILFLRHFWCSPLSKPPLDSWDLFWENCVPLSSP